MFLCEVCGAMYEWEMFFNNHRRSVHQLKVVDRPRSILTYEQRTFLKSYFTEVCTNPTLDEIKHMAYFLNIRKESVYWWFFNQNKKAKREKHGMAKHTTSHEKN